MALFLCRANYSYKNLRAGFSLPCPPRLWCAAPTRNYRPLRRTFSGFRIRVSIFRFMSLRSGNVTPICLANAALAAGLSMLIPRTTVSTCFELGQISLIGLEFLRSTAGKCQDVEGEDDVFLAAIIAQLHLLPFVAEKREIRRNVAHLQVVLATASSCRCGVAGAANCAARPSSNRCRPMS